MTAVTRAAPPRLAASASASSSKRCPSGGGLVGCKRKTSRSRGLSSSWTCTSWSGKRSVFACARGRPRQPAIALARPGLARPAMSIGLAVIGHPLPPAAVRFSCPVRASALGAIVHEDEAGEPRGEFVNFRVLLLAADFPALVHAGPPVEHGRALAALGTEDAAHAVAVAQPGVKLELQPAHAALECVDEDALAVFGSNGTRSFSHELAEASAP